MFIKKEKTEVPEIAMNGKEICVNENYVTDMINGKNCQVLK